MGFCLHSLLPTSSTLTGLCVLGRALAIKLHGAGKTVIIAGRRQENLDALSEELGHERVFSVKWDIADLARIPATVEAISGNYGNRLNAVVIVSGIQRTTDFTNPEVNLLSIVLYRFLVSPSGTQL